ncbi:MAG: discoidin domain-containing protein, partial [Solirubrobacteraceae bacterium]
MPAAASRTPVSQTLLVSLDHPLARFAPLRAIGGALDGHGEAETLPAYAPESVRGMSAAGLGAITYRLRTELGVQAWHFDPSGDWSEPARQQGYWTGTSRPPRTPPAVSWGYELPRRGDTTDQAEDGGYSRLDDGSAQTFWKSDPYLDSHFTHEPEARHPQWVVIDLGRLRAIDALRIAWAAPYARRFRVQRYVGGNDAIALDPGRWADFPRGGFGGAGGVQTVRLAQAPMSVRFVRILMTASSHTSTPSSRGERATSRDVRDRLGYAIRELYLGVSERNGAFRDLLVHATSKSQTTIYTSSTDPWHRAADLNPAYEQPSFQTVLGSGLTRAQPLLVPVPLLYGTPENAVAELRYLRGLHIALRGVELGEEPDGQLVSPEDYGALYVQFARAIRRAFPHLPIGGPAFASSIPDWAYWPNAHGDRSWTHRFVDYLRARRALRLLSFFSFEWYPFDNTCGQPSRQLRMAPRLLANAFADLRRAGVPAALPKYVTEYGYSAFSGRAEVGMPGALLDSQVAAQVLSSGGSAAYLYGYEPDVLISEEPRCDSWGNLL